MGLIPGSPRKADPSGPGYQEKGDMENEGAVGLGLQRLLAQGRDLIRAVAEDPCL